MPQPLRARAVRCGRLSVCSPRSCAPFPHTPARTAPPPRSRQNTGPPPSQARQRPHVSQSHAIRAPAAYLMHHARVPRRQQHDAERDEGIIRHDEEAGVQPASLKDVDVQLAPHQVNVCQAGDPPVPVRVAPDLEHARGRPRSQQASERARSSPPCLPGGTPLSARHRTRRCAHARKHTRGAYARGAAYRFELLHGGRVWSGVANTRRAPWQAARRDPRAVRRLDGSAELRAYVVCVVGGASQSGAQKKPSGFSRRFPHFPSGGAGAGARWQRQTGLAQVS